MIGGHERWRGEECLNLIASENVTSHTVRQLLKGDMGHRYRADDQYYRGTRFMDGLEELGERLACEVFGADWASLRPLSGHVADMIMISTLTKPGDSIVSVGPSDGGYPGLSGEGYPPLAGVRTLYFPYDSERMNIQVDKARVLVEDEKPALVIFGQSFFLFPHPVRDLTEACKAVGSKIAYDGSHVLGLIAGGEFQEPLKEGADLLLGSTHKSFFGPQGGIILGGNGVKALVKHRQHPALVDNAHWNRMAALMWALEEARRRGGKYAAQVVANAKALARGLHDGGIPVRCADYGFTQSHQVVLDIGGKEKVDRFTGALEEANIIVDRGIRMGTSEVTRRGMKVKDMDRIAEMVLRIYRGEDPARIRRMAIRLRKEFNSLEFT